MAISVAPLTTTVMNSVEENRAGLASGVNNAVSRSAGLIAIAVLGIVMLLVFRSALDLRLGELKLSPPVVQSIRAQSTKLAAIDLRAVDDTATREQIGDAVGQSFIAGFRAVSLIGALLAVASALTAATVIRQSSRPR
jgi:type IV secretory pathway TrbF-like protein